MFGNFHSKAPKRLTAVALAALAFAQAISGAPFANLDFESAAVVPVPPAQPGFVPISQGLPGWHGFLGNREQTDVLHNTSSLGSSALGIWGPASTLPIEGSFSALLQAGLDPINPLLPLDVSLAQTGFIPLDTQSVQFKLKPYGPPFLSPFTVELADQPISMIPLSTTAEYTLFGGNIVSFAGTAAELRITAHANASGPNYMFLDNIVFSSTPIPEPSSWALLSLGLVCLATLIRKRACS
jgi:hypothetical protein